MIHLYYSYEWYGCGCSYNFEFGSLVKYAENGVFSWFFFFRQKWVFLTGCDWKQFLVRCNHHDGEVTIWWLDIHKVVNECDKGSVICFDSTVLVFQLVTTILDNLAFIFIRGMVFVQPLYYNFLITFFSYSHYIFILSLSFSLSIVLNQWEERKWKLSWKLSQIVLHISLLFSFEEKLTT